MSAFQCKSQMSVVPFATQIAGWSANQCSQQGTKIIVIYTERMTDRQVLLMKEAKEYLRNLSLVNVIQANELERLPKHTRLFVIPAATTELIKRIRSNFDNSRIYLPRAVIEALGCRQTQLPVRKLALSMTMHECRIFLVKSCDIPSIRGRINEMSGLIASSFHDDALNVVITDRADDRYSTKAFKKGIPVVSREWIDDSYGRASREDQQFFNYDARTRLEDFKIKPFYGLYFKIQVSDPGAKLKNLITDNQGKLIYGDQVCTTHVVAPKESESSLDSTLGLRTKSTQDAIKTVDVDFLYTCAELGHYLTKRDYQDHLDHQNRIADKSDHGAAPESTPTTSSSTENISPSTNFGPSESLKQTDNMDDLVLRGLSMFETPQTQAASTQMRRLPEKQLIMEPLYEPSQQLFWSDNFSKRH